MLLQTIIDGCNPNVDDNLKNHFELFKLFNDDFNYLKICNHNKSHIHSSTNSSSLRTSTKGWRFCSIFYWLSSISNQLLNSRHFKLYAEFFGLNLF